MTAIAAQTDTGATDIDAGHVVTITLDLREVVTVINAPVLTLNDGGTATYQSGNDTDALTFTTTIQPGQSAADLTITGLDTTNGTIQRQHHRHAAGGDRRLKLQRRDCRQRSLFQFQQCALCLGRYGRRDDPGGSILQQRANSRLGRQRDLR